MSNPSILSTVRTSKSSVPFRGFFKVKGYEADSSGESILNALCMSTNEEIKIKMAPPKEGSPPNRITIDSLINSKYNTTAPGGVVRLSSVRKTAEGLYSCEYVKSITKSADDQHNAVIRGTARIGAIQYRLDGAGNRLLDDEGNPKCWTNIDVIQNEAAVKIKSANGFVAAVIGCLQKVNTIGMPCALIRGGEKEMPVKVYLRDAVEKSQQQVYDELVANQRGAFVELLRAFQGLEQANKPFPDYEIVPCESIYTATKTILQENGEFSRLKKSTTAEFTVYDNEGVEETRKTTGYIDNVLIGCWRKDSQSSFCATSMIAERLKDVPVTLNGMPASAGASLNASQENRNDQPRSNTNTVSSQAQTPQMHASEADLQASLSAAFDELEKVSSSPQQNNLQSPGSSMHQGMNN